MSMNLEIDRDMIYIRLLLKSQLTGLLLLSRSTLTVKMGLSRNKKSLN